MSHWTSSDWRWLTNWRTAPLSHWRSGVVILSSTTTGLTSSSATMLLALMYTHWCSAAALFLNCLHSTSSVQPVLVRVQQHGTKLTLIIDGKYIWKTGPWKSSETAYAQNYRPSALACLPGLIRYSRSIYSVSNLSNLWNIFSQLFVLRQLE